MGNKISLVIPHYPTEDTDAALDRCLESYKGQYDELVLVVNDGMGYGPAVNRGLRYITGDYIIVSNNDITLQSGTLRDLPHPKAITVPMIEPMPKDLLPRAIFCMPKQIFSWIMAFGYFYDEDFGLGYWEDDDLIRRLGDTKVIVRENVVVNHLHGGGMTMKKFGEQEWHDRNEKVFKEKWPDTYS